MDAYLINNGKEFVLLYNRLKKAEEKAAEAAGRGWRRRLAENIPLYNLCVFTSRWSEAVIKSSNGELLAADSGSFVLRYADTRDEKEAREGFERIVRGEMRRLGMVAAANLVLIPLAYIPPLILVPMTSPLFALAAYQSLRLKRAVKKGAKKACFMPDSAVSELEKKILEGSGKNAEEWFSEYEFT